MIMNGLLGVLVFLFLVRCQGSSLRKISASISSEESKDDVQLLAGTKRSSEADLHQDDALIESPKKSFDDAALERQFREAVEMREFDLLAKIAKLTKGSEFRIKSDSEPGHWTYPLHFILYRRDDICFYKAFNLLSDQVDLIDSSGHSALSLAIATDNRSAFNFMFPKTDLQNTIVLGGLKLMHVAAMIPKRNFYLASLIEFVPEQLTEPCTRNGWTPFIYAALQDIGGNFQFMAEQASLGLIEHKNNGPLLHVLYNANQKEKIEAVLKYEPVYDYEDELGNNIIHWAARDGRAYVIEMIRRNITQDQFEVLLGAKNSSDEVPIVAAIKGKHFVAFKLMAPLSVGYLAMVPVAIEYGALDILKYLVRSEIYKKEYWPYSDASQLVFAYNSFQRSIAIYLLELTEVEELYGTESDYFHNIMQLAVDAEDSSMVAKLILKGFDVNRHEASTNSPLAIAVVHQDTEIVRMLLRAGADRDVSFTYASGEKTHIFDIATPAVRNFLIELFPESNTEAVVTKENTKVDTEMK